MAKQSQIFYKRITFMFTKLLTEPRYTIINITETKGEYKSTPIIGMLCFS